VLAQAGQWPRADQYCRRPAESEALLAARLRELTFLTTYSPCATVRLRYTRLPHGDGLLSSTPHNAASAIIASETASQMLAHLLREQQSRSHTLPCRPRRQREYAS